MVALCLLQPWQGEYDHDHERDEGEDGEDGGYEEDVDCDDIDDVDDYHNYSDIAACGPTNLRRLARGCWLWTRWRTPSRYHKNYYDAANAMQNDQMAYTKPVSKLVWCC